MTNLSIESPATGITTISINRPRTRNACDSQTWQELASAFSKLGQDKDARVMILTGHAGHFCSGNDIRATAAISGDISLMKKRTQAVDDCFHHLRALRIPTIAAIHGVCVGGGCTLASYCDFRVADTTSRIGITAAKHSIAYPTAHLVRLTSIIGLAAARR